MKERLHKFSFFLVAVLLIKVSAFHVYEEHDILEDTGSHCELCLTAVEGLQLEGMLPSFVDIPGASITLGFNPLLATTTQALPELQISGQFFSRPPPTSLG